MFQEFVLRVCVQKPNQPLGSFCSQAGPEWRDTEAATVIGEASDGKGFRCVNPEARRTWWAPGYRLDAVRVVLGGSLEARHDCCVSELAVRIRNPLRDCRRQVDTTVWFVCGFIIVIPVEAQHLFPDEQIYSRAGCRARIDRFSCT